MSTHMHGTILLQQNCQFTRFHVQYAGIDLCTCLEWRMGEGLDDNKPVCSVTDFTKITQKCQIPGGGT